MNEDEAFRELTERYRRELQLHCYRMLGSFQDAEDALQETFVKAWKGLGGFEERSSVRTWLYRIATRQCLDARRSAKRRLVGESKVPRPDWPEPTRLGEVVWLQPLPDGPEARYEQSESISLAFVTALQLLPPRQLAVLVLRDVLEFEVSQVAEMLDTTVQSVNSALKRARAKLAQRQQTAADREPPPVAGSVSEKAIVAKFLKAYETANIDALVAMLTDDVFLSMPPLPLEYAGREVVSRFMASIFAGPARHLIPTRANGQPAFALYVRGPDGVRHATGLLVLTLTGDRICEMVRFESSVLPWFGLPRSLP